jgi:hypothetical protein
MSSPVRPGSVTSKIIPLRAGAARRDKEFLVTSPNHRFTCTDSSHEGYLTED